MILRAAPPLIFGLVHLVVLIQSDRTKPTRGGSRRDLTPPYLENLDKIYDLELVI